MGKVSIRGKNDVKSPKNAKSKVDYSYPKPIPRHQPIHLTYYMDGVCASLKNSQQVVPGNTKLSARIDRLTDAIAGMENKGEKYHDQLQVMRQEYLELKNKLIAGEDRARKHWLIQCERYKRWLQKVLPDFRIWMDQMTDKHQLNFPVGHIEVTILFYFPNLLRRDGPNKEQAIFDMFKAVGLVPDDSWTVIDACTWKAALYRPRPRTEIYIKVKDRHRSLWADHMQEANRSRRTGKKGLAGMLAADNDNRIV